MTDTIPPNPGSPEAKKQGCTCATQDNGNGRGCGLKSEDGFPLFWIEPECPIHGDESNA